MQELKEAATYLRKQLNPSHSKELGCPDWYSDVPELAGESAIIDEVRAFQLHLKNLSWKRLFL